MKRILLPIFFFIIFLPVFSFAEEPLHIILFGERGCNVCQKVKDSLVPAYAKKLGIKFQITEYLADKHLDTFNALEKKYRFNRRALPVLFVSDKVFSGRIEIEEGLYKSLEDYKKGKFPNINVLRQLTQTDRTHAGQQVLKEFKTWNIGTVIGAGLIDGINPCAFATIIFLISYLAYVGRKRKEVVIIATVYTVVVFLTYLAVGIIFYDIIDRLRGAYNVISAVIFYITFSLCIIFAVFTLYDFVKALQNKSSEMTLTLSKKFKQRIHKVIRERVKMRGLIVSSVVIGFLVSMFELACTGQVYLPTIMFILHKSQLKSTGLFYLVIYNLAFILPLVIIFILNLAGISSERLQHFLHKHLALTKALLFLLFVGIAVYLVVDRFV